GELGLVSLAGGVWMLFNVGYILVVSFGPALLMSQGLSQRDAGFMTSLVSWTVIITIPLGGVLIDRVGHATTLMIASFAGLGLSAMLMPALAGAHDIHWRPGGTTGRYPDDATGRSFAPAKSRAGMGIFFTWYYAGLAVLTPIGGILRDASGVALSMPYEHSNQCPPKPPLCASCSRTMQLARTTSRFGDLP